jgi:hypothetical protein
MGIFSTILDKIFHHPAAGQIAGNILQQARQATTASAASPPQPQSAPSAQPQQPAAPQASASPTPQAQPASPQVEVEAVLTRIAADKGGGGNWRTSIVDLLKLLDMDSSLDARKQLANEIGVHVGADGSAEENVALHQAVMRKLEENGGKVPESLKTH